MQVSSPNQITSGSTKLEQAISLFEQKFKQEKDKNSNYFHLVIRSEFNRETCDEVEQTYLKAGWKTAKCKTSSENGERGGLTGLQLTR